MRGRLRADDLESMAQDVDVGADAEAPFCAAELASVLTDVEATEQKMEQAKVHDVFPALPVAERLART